MSEPIFRDAIEDDQEDMDPGEIHAFLDERVKPKLEVVSNDSPADEMIAEIIENAIAAEVETFPWREPHLSAAALEGRYSISRMIDLDFSDGNPSIMARIAKEAARIIQFPENTAYLHGLGVFSSATVLNFQVEQNEGYTPSGMYTLCAQPSGSGKSSVHNFFIKPIHDALDLRNRPLYIDHKIIDNQIKDLNTKIDKLKHDDRTMVKALSTELQSLQDEKIKRPMVGHATKNITPEAAEEKASAQGGVINICSDEQEALDSYLGLAYGDNKSSPNNGVFIAAFGGDSINTSRISREGYKGGVRGAFAVIAQNASIDIMVKAGASGRGVSERCLIIKERNLIGYRTYSRDRAKFDPELISEYKALCENIVAGDYPLRLTFSEECRDLLVDLKNMIEPQSRSGMKYGDDQIRGFASKIDQHIVKLAANFHIAEQWNPKVTSKPSFEIQANNLTKAMLVCMDLLESYKTMIESASSFSGSKLVLEIIGTMKLWSTKGCTNFKMEKLRLAVAKQAWYSTIDGKKIDYLVNLIRRAEEMNFCHLKEDGLDKKKWHVLINPALRDFTIAVGE